MENLTVKLTSLSGGVLKTAKTYCENDIEIMPKLQEKIISESGMVQPDEGFCGLSKVTVDIEEKINEAYQQGEKSEYDRFWDDFQKNGTRTDYTYAFSNSWTDKMSSPKYDIHPINASHMFTGCGVKNIKQWIQKNNTTFDTSMCTNFSYAFSGYNAAIEIIPSISLISVTSSNNLIGAFGWLAHCHTIEKIILKNDGSTPLINSMFINSSSFVNILIEGIIGQNGFNIQYSTKLSYDSIISIISALSDSTSGLMITLSQNAVNNAFETSSGAADGSTSEEWATLIATKPNWTISLV